MSIDTILLLVILGLILILPLLIRSIERNLEIFFLLMAVIAASITNSWSIHLIEEALKTPVMIHEKIPIGLFQVVLTVGLIFHFLRDKVVNAVEKLISKYSPRVMFTVLSICLGLASSFISAIIASVILAEILAITPISRREKLYISVIACFSIGLGAALTPVGEPLSTIAIQKLSKPPYNAGFFFLLEHLGIYVIPTVIAISLTVLKIIPREIVRVVSEVHIIEKLSTVFWRAIKIYLFIVALVILGKSYEILVVKYFKYLSPEILYWIGLMSAVLDNATLTAAFISSELSLFQIKSFLMSLLIAGGILVPGNVPNIIVASRIGITFKEWAKFGIIIGMPLFIIFYIILHVI